LTDSNFNSQVLNSKFVWMVEFYAPWCGHCKSLQPHWDASAKKVNNVKWGKVDCTQNQSVCGQYGVQGYPTIKAFTPGARSSSDALPYEGGRTEGDLSSFAEGLFSSNAPAKELKQLKSQNDYKESCVDSNGVCFIFLIPHILDSSEEERKEFIDMFTEVKI
jgi:protein disulfide-isomerase A6